MIIAVFNSGNFEFIAAGETKEQADAALLKAWRKHVRQTGADRDMMKVAVADGDVNYLDIKPGQCARDWSVIAG